MVVYNFPSYIEWHIVTGFRTNPLPTKFREDVDLVPISGDQDNLHGGRRSCNAVIIRSFKLTFQVSSEGDTGFDYIDEP